MLIVNYRNTPVFNIECDVIQRGIQAMLTTCVEFDKDPQAFLKKVFPNEPDHFIQYLLGKCQTVTTRLDTTEFANPPKYSISLLLSRKMISDAHIRQIAKHITTLDGEPITIPEQTACSWLARVFRASMYCIEMEKLFPSRGDIMMNVLSDQGFEMFMSQLTNHGVQKCIDWANKMCKEKGHVGYDHEILLRYFDVKQGS